MSKKTSLKVGVAVTALVLAGTLVGEKLTQQPQDLRQQASSTTTPIMNISYPQNGSTIRFDSPSQTLCMVDTPVENTQGIQRRHKLNAGEWEPYANHYTLCFEPAQGENTLQVQYRNNTGGESAVQTIRFTFVRDHEPQQVSLSTYEVMRTEFLRQKNSYQTDLNLDGRVDLIDYSLLVNRL